MRDDAVAPSRPYRAVFGDVELSRTGASPSRGTRTARTAASTGGLRWGLNSGPWVHDSLERSPARQFAVMFQKDSQQLYKYEFPLRLPALGTSLTEITEPTGNLFCTPL